MRIGVLALSLFVAVAGIVFAFFMQEMTKADKRAAAEALIAATEPSRKAVLAATGNTSSLSGVGKLVGTPAPVGGGTHGDFKIRVDPDGVVRGWNEKNAMEVALTPRFEKGKVVWRCAGYPSASMPDYCRGGDVVIRD